jgi:transposase
METIHMSHKEIPRAGLLKAALAGKITNREGAKALQLTLRHFQRLKARFQEEGAAGLPHRSRGRPSGRGLPAGVRKKVTGLMKTTYAGLNDSHMTEKLREVEEISIARETVRQIRIENGLAAQRRRRSPKHRSRRLREGRRGALAQIDGSTHDWLEGRAPIMCLHGSVDDATGDVLGLHFELTEDMHGYATLFQQVFTEHGLPVAMYGDRTGILVRNDNYWTVEEELQGYRGPTHMGQMLDDLGIGYIEAHSPQAKGRIENRWSTLQDRLVQEMRLLGISSIEAANAFLPEFKRDFNKRFARSPRESASAWRPAPRNLPMILSCRYLRTVANDNTVTLGPSRERGAQGEPWLTRRWIQIPAGPRKRSYAGCQVELRELLDGRLIANYHGIPIAVQAAPKTGFHLTSRTTHPKTRRRTVLENKPRSPKPVLKTRRATGTPKKRPVNPLWKKLPGRHLSPYAKKRDDIFAWQ